MAAIVALRGAQRGKEMGRRIAKEKIREAAANAQVATDKQQALADDIIKTYDVDRSGTLDHTELKPMLSDYARLRFSEQGLVPSAQDIEFVVKLCDRKGPGGKEGDGLIDRIEVLDVCHIWSDYMEKRANMLKLLEKYDKDFDGELDAEELGALLAEVNGHDLPPEVVTWIFSVADVWSRAFAVGALHRMLLV
eukprot:TRINITY_DN5612_c0_g2_i2.p1 TRINITY_DN5612_c0_g2~~TRINITY_DN5612_c0_g2_i2.p1  ORF type:complete len:193 (+),score=45.61 TRINITY_DN5612_c0_g2_i2:74-652(+)